MRLNSYTERTGSDTAFRSGRDAVARPDAQPREMTRSRARAFVWGIRNRRLSRRPKCSGPAGNEAGSKLTLPPPPPNPQTLSVGGTESNDTGQIRSVVPA